MFFRMLERADRRHDVGHQRLFAAAMAEILADRLREILCMIDQQRDRAVDAVAAHRPAFGHRRGEAVLLRRQHTPPPLALARDAVLHRLPHTTSPSVWPANETAAWGGIGCQYY